MVFPLRKFIEMTELLGGNGLFKNKFSDRELTIQIYNEHIQNVTRNVPKEDLLIFDVKEGWKPLCGFLDVDVPENISFPHLTTGDTMAKILNAVRILPYIVVIIIMISIITLLIYPK